MKDVIISIERKQDNIILENQYKFQVLITIGLEKLNDFYVKLEFLNLEIDDMKTLQMLFEIKREISIQSDLITKEQFNITHIVVESMNIDGALNVVFECVSDEPFDLEL